MNSDEALKIMAKAYYELLTALQSAFNNNENIKIGLREGLQVQPVRAVPKRRWFATRAAGMKAKAGTPKSPTACETK